MQTNVNQFGEVLSLPDLWQRKALNLLREGQDVVLHAPTGAGKTFVFEQLIESGWKGKAVYTVPTRALANDKFRDWSDRGWDVGLVTGDLRHNPEARVVVATLETQRGNVAKGTLPDLLVVDEYQLLGDQKRGPAYEVTLAMAPNSVRLLLMSGSVANPDEVADWLRGQGRTVSLVSEKRRPVPLDEVFAEALLKSPFRGRKIRGQWPKLVAAALRSGLGPLLVFAPRRKAAEELAIELARELPEVEPLELTSEQKKIAGKDLSSLLRRRVSYHHSGMDYMKRAGVIEPLAKTGQLQVVVATTGLGAGINFSMRSVLVTDREYRVEEKLFVLRHDELLQMFGRAGRRGFDDRGYVVVAPKQARMSDARPLKLTRSETLDWPAILRVMSGACARGDDHLDAGRWLAERLFSEDRVKLGFRDSLAGFSSFWKGEEERNEALKENLSERDQVIEMRNSAGLWERRGGQSQACLGEAWVLDKGEWVRALTLPDTLSKVKAGNPCRFGKRKEPVYGREIPVGVYDSEDAKEKVVLIKSFRKKLKESVTEKPARIRKTFSRKVWRREGLEQVFKDLFPDLSQGGEFVEFVDRGKVLRARLRYEKARILGWRDSRGRVLLNPPMRKVTRMYESPFRENGNGDGHNLNDLTPAEAWVALKLIDAQGAPTLRGEIFSFFSGGEGLAVAVALEDETYPVEELVFDLANLRSGHRFKAFSVSEARLTVVCRAAFGFQDCRGYLKGGLPAEYGEGAVEVLREHKELLASSDLERDFSSGDVERLRVEWKSLLALIAYGPRLDNPRWLALQEEALRIIGPKEVEQGLPALPTMPARQRRRFQTNRYGNPR